MSGYTFLDALSTPIVGTVIDGRVVYKTDELRAQYETRNPNPLQARRDEIKSIFQNEPLDKTAALALIDELAEIETVLGSTLSAADEIEDFPF